MAVVVTHDPGHWFDDTMASLAEQDYPNLSILVVDSGSATDPTPTVARWVPDAFVTRLSTNRGFGAAANRVLGMVEGASFFLFCHDDVALEPDACRLMVEEAFRSNAAIVGPKLVDWDRPEVLLSVGAAVDKFGFPAPVAEPGELDQQQHDAVRDVFMVSDACILTRSDLFRAIGGFPADVDFFEEDLDLCWRAHTAGARVISCPDAVVRHRAAVAERRSVVDRRRREFRHRARAVLANYSAAHLVRVVPQAAAMSVLDLVVSLLSARFSEAVDVVGAWLWNLARLPGTVRQRRRHHHLRRASDADVRRFMVRGSSRLTAFVRGTVIEGTQRINQAGQVSRSLADRIREGPSQIAVGVVALGSLLLVWGSRGVIGGLPAMRELPAAGGSWTAMLGDFWRGWRTSGLGATSAPPTLLAAMGALSGVLFGAEGAARALVPLACLPIGAVGAYRLARGAGSGRVQAATFLAYVANPLPYNCLAEGRMGGLALWAGLPWMMWSVLAAGGDEPFLDTKGSRYNTGRLALGCGLVLAAVATFTPFAFVTLALVTAAVLLGRWCGGQRMSRTRPALVVAGGAGVVALLVHLPWALSVLLPVPRWSAIVGFHASSTKPLALHEILSFRTGPNAAAWMTLGLVLAATLPLAVGERWRWRLAAQCWAVALGSFALAVASQGHLPFTLPPVEVLLVPAALGIALGVGCAVAAFEHDVFGGDFGWRQFASAGALFLAVIGALPIVGFAFGGRWAAPETDLNSVLSLLTPKPVPGGARTLWIGDADVLPMGGWPLTGGAVFATTNGLTPGPDAWFPGPEGAGTRELRAALESAVSGESSRLGRLLAPMGVEYVVAVRGPTVAAFSPTLTDPPGGVTEALAQQLDLGEVTVNPAVVVYRNASFKPERVRYPKDALAGTRADPESVLRTDLSQGTGALGTGASGGSFTGRVAANSEIYVADTADQNWRMEVDGRRVTRQSAFGWAARYPVAKGGEVRLAYRTPLIRMALVLIELAAVVILVNLYRRSRRVPSGQPVVPIDAARERRRARQADRRNRSRPSGGDRVDHTTQLPVIVVREGGSDADMSEVDGLREPGRGGGDIGFGEPLGTEPPAGVAEPEYWVAEAEGWVADDDRRWVEDLEADLAAPAEEPEGMPPVVEVAPPAPEPVLPEPVLPEPVLPEPVLPEPVLPEPVLPEPVLPENGEPGSGVSESVSPVADEDRSTADTAHADKADTSPDRVLEVDDVLEVAPPAGDGSGELTPEPFLEQLALLPDTPEPARKAKAVTAKAMVPPTRRRTRKAVDAAGPVSHAEVEAATPAGEKPKRQRTSKKRAVEPGDVGSDADSGNHPEPHEDVERVEKPDHGDPDGSARALGRSARNLASKAGQEAPKKATRGRTRGAGSTSKPPSRARRPRSDGDGS